MAITVVVTDSIYRRKPSKKALYMVTTESRGLDASDKKYVYFSFTFCFRF